MDDRERRIEGACLVRENERQADPKVRQLAAEALAHYRSTGEYEAQREGEQGDEKPKE